MPALQLTDDFGVVTGAATPRRLCDRTRDLATRALSGEWGLDMKPATFALDKARTAGLSRDPHYALAVQAIAAQAPLRIVPGEKFVGAATLLEATWHRVPLTEISSTSHTTIGFDSALRTGCNAIRAQIAARLERGDLDDRGRGFLEAMRTCLDAQTAWRDRYARELEARIASSRDAEREDYRQVLATLGSVPDEPPHGFRQALQALWILWDFNRLCGNWSGLGRLDVLLGPYLRADLEQGRVTLDEARELLAHFWIKGCEWIGANDFKRGSGDAQFYQNVVLAGVDAEGRDVTNEVTHLVLDVVEELHISDFPIAVRVNARTPKEFVRRVARVQRRGGGIVAIYNEDVILPALERFGYAPAEARTFANDGCWEIIIPGKTAFSYRPFDTLRLLQNAVGLGPDNLRVPAAPDFASLYGLFRRELEVHLDRFHAEADGAFRNGPPTPLLSALVEGCVANARGYADRGPVYTLAAPHAGGIPDTANSLLAIRTLVYDRRALTLEQLVEVLRADWNGHEALRQEAARVPTYGNDDAEADAMARRVYDDFVELASRVRERAGVLRPPGISTFGRELAFRQHRVATAFGRRKGDILAANLAPTPGTDTQGPTAVIRSFCSLDFRKLPNGVPLELKILPATLRGEAGVNALAALLQAFVELGGVFLHVDVVDSRVLREAQAHPERYPNLSVRVSGWSARFATLDRDWQEMIIQRTQQGR